MIRYRFLATSSSTCVVGSAAMLLTSVCSAQPLPKQETGDFDIGGQCVVWRTTKVIAGVTVHLIKQDGLIGEPELVDTTETDDQGRFEFTGLEPPSELRTATIRYTLICDAKDHAVQFQRVFPYRHTRTTRIGLNPQQGVLRGTVVDPDGKPIAHAKIRTWNGAPLGVGMATTAASGSFELTRLPAANPDTPLKSLLFQISSPGFPTLYARAEVPSMAKFTMQNGCALRGTVRSKDTGQGVAGAIVTAMPIKSSIQEERTLTDEQGRFELSVAEGSYHIVLEDAKLVAPAITDVECRAGTSRELAPMVASHGGWLTGRIIHPRTGDPVVFTDGNQRIVVNAYGPATPKRRVIGGRQMALVNDDGRFRIRVAPGANYPYLVNIQAERMGWDTERQPPIHVPDGGVARCFIKIKVKRSDEEKLADARELLQSLPQNKTKRSEAILTEFRKLNHTASERELWCLLMKDLVDIGPDAVLLLCRELDKTKEQHMMRRLGFALRAINDPRAVPSLIRAIPKTLQPSMSDYGLIVADADLLSFMQAHDLDPADRQGRHFSFGRPVREIFGALNKISGQQFSESELYHVHRAKDQRALYWQQKQYQATARQWRDWWEKNWQDTGVDKTFRDVNLKPLIQVDLDSLPAGLRLTADAKIDRQSRGMTLSAIADKEGSRYFLDLDTGRTLDWPESLPRTEQSPAVIQKATDWAAKHGADLICVRHDDGSDKSPYVLRGIGVQLWEIDPQDANKINKRIKEGKLPDGFKIDDNLLMHLDQKTNKRSAKVGSSFMYLSREQGLGIITITDFASEAGDITGMLQAPASGGHHPGVRFGWKTIAR